MRLTDEQIVKIARFARQTSHGAYGATRKLALELDLDPRSLRVMVHHYRAGRVPIRWRAALKDKL